MVLFDDLVEDDAPPLPGGVGSVEDGDLPLLVVEPAKGVVQGSLQPTQVTGELSRRFITLGF